jgi:hypothetical protein
VATSGFTLSENASKASLASYGVPVAPEHVVAFRTGGSLP